MYMGRCIYLVEFHTLFSQIYAESGMYEYIYKYIIKMEFESLLIEQSKVVWQ
jgi:hypothetical protein